MKTINLSQALWILLSLVLSTCLGLILYSQNSFLALITTILGITALSGVITTISYRGWLFFGVHVLGFAAGLVIGKIYWL
jgi:hypothetical protein